MLRLTSTTFNFPFFEFTEVETEEFGKMSLDV